MNIKLLPLVSLLVITMSSCSSKIIPIKGMYPKPPITYNSSNSADVVWDKLVDLFAQRGFVIKIIDRSSGLIISTGKMPVTTELESGRLRDSTAFIVAAKHKVYGGYVL